MYKSADRTTKRAIYGRGAVDRVQVDHDVMPSGLFDGILRKPDRITDWFRVVWLRDIEIVQCALCDAPHPYDAAAFAHPLSLRSTRQGSHFFPPENQMAEIDDALNHNFERYGAERRERPDGIWWNDSLPHERHLFRSDFEQD
jgi:hypothetical protein